MEGRAASFLELDRIRHTYMLIHKKPVGPKTANRLFSHSTELSQFQDSQAMYEAGSAASEAAISGNLDDIETRLRRVQTAKECWEYAQELEIERAAGSAYLKNTTPDRVREFRIATALARVPLIEDIAVQGYPTKSGLVKARDKQLEVMQEVSNELSNAERQDYTGRISSYKGLSYEQLAVGAIDRMLSKRITLLPSYARADNAYPYPDQTHDLQVFEFHKSNISHITPIEAKSRLRVKHSQRYSAALLGGEVHLLRSGITYHQAVNLMTREAQDIPLSGKEKEHLEIITDGVIHVMRHYKRERDFGKHCLNLADCRIQKTVTEPVTV